MNVRLLAAGLILVAALFSVGVVRGDEPAAGFDRYGDPLPAGALVRLGTKRLQTKGGFAWLPDGKSLVTLRYGKVTFWDMADGRAIDSFYVPVGEKRSSRAQLALSSDGKRLVCTDASGAIAVCTGWAEGRNSTIVTPAAEPDDQGENLILVMLPSGRTFITLRRTGELQFRDTSTMAIQRTVALADKDWSSPVLVALSPNGKTLALADGSSRSIYLVNTADEGDAVVIPDTHGGALASLAFLENGKLLSSAAVARKPLAEGKSAQVPEFRIWELGKKTPLEVWADDDAPSPSCKLCVTPDGKTFVAIFANQIAVWNAESKRVIRRIEGIRFWNHTLGQAAIDPTGKFVAIADWHNYVRIWDVATGLAHWPERQHHRSLIACAAWSPDGTTIATGDSTEVILWNAATGKTLRTIPGPDYGTWGLQFSPDTSRLVICGQDRKPAVQELEGRVRWHDPGTGELLHGHDATGQARLPVFSPDGSLLAYYALNFETGGPILVADASNGKVQAAIVKDEFIPSGLAWGPDGKSLFVGADNGTVRQFNTLTRTVTAKLELPHERKDAATGALMPGRMYHARFTRNRGRVISSGNLPEIYCWDLATGKKQWTIETASTPRALALSGNDKTVAAIEGGDNDAKLLQLFDVGTQKKLAEYDLGQENCQCLEFSPDGRRLLAGFEDGTALVMDATAR